MLTRLPQAKILPFGCYIIVIQILITFKRNGALSKHAEIKSLWCCLVTPSTLSDHTYAAAVASKILLHYAQIATKGYVLCEVSAGRNFAFSELQLRSPRWHGSPQAVRVSASLRACQRRNRQDVPIISQSRHIGR